MRALFLAASIFGLLSGHVCAQEMISNRAEDLANLVFIGPDEEMPNDGSKLFSITRPDVSGELAKSWSFEVAFRALQRIVPKWQQVAMRNASGDDECSANVNGIPYTTYLLAWVQVEWRLKDRESPAFRAFEAVGITDEEMIMQALQSGFCEFLKGGEKAGVAAIVAYGRESP